MKNISEKMNKNYIVIPFALFCCLLWGSAFPMIKVGYTLFRISDTDTPSIILFAGMRFFLAGMITISVFSIAERRMLLPSRRSVGPIAVLSVFQTILQYLFFYLGLAFTTGSKASVVNGTGVLFVLIISCFVMKQERFTLRKLCICFLGFAGVLVTNISGINGFSFNKGDIFIILSSVSYAASTVLMRRYSTRENPALLSGYQFILGGLVMTSFGMLMGGKLGAFTFSGCSVLIYLAFVSAAAYSLWSMLLKYNDASRVAVFGSFTPIFGFVLSLIILKERGSGIVFNVVGLLLVVLATVFSNIHSKNNCN